MRTRECDRNRDQVNITSLRSELNSDPPSVNSQRVKVHPWGIVGDLSLAPHRIKKKLETQS